MTLVDLDSGEVLSNEDLEGGEAYMSLRPDENVRRAARRSYRTACKAAVAAMPTIEESDAGCETATEVSKPDIEEEESLSEFEYVLNKGSTEDTTECTSNSSMHSLQKPLKKQVKHRFFNENRVRWLLIGICVIGIITCIFFVTREFVEAKDSNKKPHVTLPFVLHRSSDGETAPIQNFDPIRINAGGDSFLDYDGNYWTDDYALQSNSDGGIYSECGAGQTIENTHIPRLYCSERNFKSKGRIRVPLSWQVSAGGKYQVNLHFAEIFYTESGERIFNVKVNGEVIRQNFDIVEEGGKPFAAVMLSTTVDGTSLHNGYLIVELEKIKGDPKISGIEVLPVSRR